MRYYCTLFMRSDREDAPASAFKRAAIGMLDFDDSRSAVNVARAERWRDQPGTRLVIRNDLPRYRWILSSRDIVGTEESDAFVHVSWLLSRLKTDVLISDLVKQGMECELSFYWGGQGTGGGPTVTARLSELLCRHQVNLQIGFYYEGASS